MTDTSPTVSDTSTFIKDSRYPRPAWFRALRWIFIHWWILPIACLVAYLLPAILLHTLFSNLLFLVQHWWVILLTLIGLAGVGTLLFLLYRWADDDFWAERSELGRPMVAIPELRRREIEEMEQQRPQGFVLRHILRGHSSFVNSVAWAPDGRILASGSGDSTIRLWDLVSGEQSGIIEGHTSTVWELTFSSDGRLLASKSEDNTIRLWNTATWDEVGLLKEFTNRGGLNRPSFHPKLPNILATFGEEARAIRIWELDLETLLGSLPATDSMRYSNAKAILVGDSGVGKSGLGLVLTGHPFAATDSTHGRTVWTFESQEVALADGRREMRETLLWDLAGQPGYRLVHQLHLNEVALALIVFDSHSETDPFAGVYHWERALRHAQ